MHYRKITKKIVVCVIEPSIWEAPYLNHNHLESALQRKKAFRYLYDPLKSLPAMANGSRW